MSNDDLVDALARICAWLQEKSDDKEADAREWFNAHGDCQYVRVRFSEAAATNAAIDVIVQAMETLEGVSA